MTPWCDLWSSGRAGVKFKGQLKRPRGEGEQSCDNKQRKQTSRGSRKAAVVKACFPSGAEIAESPWTSWDPWRWAPAGDEAAWTLTRGRLAARRGETGTSAFHDFADGPSSATQIATVNVRRSRIDAGSLRRAFGRSFWSLLAARHAATRPPKGRLPQQSNGYLEPWGPSEDESPNLWRP